MTLTRPRRCVDLLRAEGFTTVWFAEEIIAQRDLIVAECGEIQIFDDLEHVKGYESGVRAKLTDWSRKHREEIKAFHILTGSRIVAMGVSLANLALGGRIVAHLKRADFENALTQAVGLLDR